MKNVELKQQAIAYIEQLSTEKLETALNYLAALRNSDLWTAEAESEKRKSSDKATPLLSLAGTLECDEENISDRHDELIGDGLLAELCGHTDPHADLVKKETPAQLRQRAPYSNPETTFTVFNIGGNKARLIAIIQYKFQQVVIHEVLTHAEYNAWSRKR